MAFLYRYPHGLLPRFYCGGEATAQSSRPLSPPKAVGADLHRPAHRLESRASTTSPPVLETYCTRHRSIKSIRCSESPIKPPFRPKLLRGRTIAQCSFQRSLRLALIMLHFLQEGYPIIRTLTRKIDVFFFCSFFHERHYWQEERKLEVNVYIVLFIITYLYDGCSMSDETFTIMCFCFPCLVPCMSRPVKSFSF